MSMHKTLLPPNALPAERALEEATTTEVLSIPDLIRAVKNPDTCPAELLPWLAWEYSVDTWLPEWNEEQKRAAIRSATYIHRHRGTRGAIETALEGLPFTYQLTEWFEQTPRGEPYTFSLVVEQAGNPVNEQHIQDFKNAVMRSKNLRSWFDMSFQNATQGTAYSASYMVASEITSYGS